MHQYKTAYTDACKTPYTTLLYKIVFQKTNPLLRNMQKTSQIKILIQKKCILLVYIV